MMRGEQTLYVASGNAGKLRDFATAADGFAAALGRAGRDDEEQVVFTLSPMPGLEAIPAPEENAETFEGNARAKAVYYSLHAPGALVIADDSGLEVDALAGAPGVYSARYAERAGPDGAGDEASIGALDSRNNRHLLEELTRVPAPLDLPANLDDRSARYRCVLAAARDGVCVEAAEGSVEGSILLAPRGTGGFGYDPLFYLPSLERSMAELDAPTRLGLSHRGAALRSLLRKLSAL